MPLLQTSGNVTADGYGGGVAAIPNYIEDVFQTWLYAGNGSTQTITNGIDLAGKGGMVWLKARTSGGSSFTNNAIIDTARGANANGYYSIYTNLTDGQFSPTGSSDAVATAVSATGFTVGGNANVNYNTQTDVSWTFRKQPKFFDVVTYTGTGSATTIAHSLGSVPGCIIVKNLDAATNWAVYHRSLGGTYITRLNRDWASDTGYENWADTDPTSTVFTVGNGNATNGSGYNYVAYVFAHNAGGFGLTGTDNVISCGSFSCPGGANATINLGYEPQWVLYKDYGAAGNWQIADTMRGFPAYPKFGSALYPNLTATDSANQIGINLTSTGFESVQSQLNGNFIYIAIRRGPMKVPTTGTSVFKPNATSAAAGTVVTTNFPVDLEIGNFLDNYDNKPFTDRLRGYATSTSSRTGAPFINSVNALGELTTGAPFSYNWWNKSVIIGNYISEYRQVSYYFGRAPNFFDIVCYTGAGNGTVVSHNLGVEPELFIVKKRSGSADWVARAPGTGADRYLLPNKTNAQADASGWYSATASQITFATAYGTTAGSGDTYVGYLFATCAGVSKVGSYTGNGTTQTINCGFTGGARFVLIKRTDSTGDWYVYDTARGMTTLVDPYLLLNSTAPESATLGSVTTVSTGFAVNASILAAINTNAASYIFLAIA